jgi:hypothetical protein
MIFANFLDLVASESFSNQHSASFDRFVSNQFDETFAGLKNAYPSYLFSEFNLYYNTERRLALASEPSEYLSWFNSRIELFAKVCLPSYDELAVKPLAWFLLCDQPQNSSEEQLLNKLRLLSSSYTIVTCDFRPAQSDQERHYVFKPNLIKRCVSSLLSSNSYSGIITSRVDTDDCLGSLYFYNLYKYIYLVSRISPEVFKGDFIANFPVGAQVSLFPSIGDITSSLQAQALIFGENCFTSRIEVGKPPSHLDTVWSCPHDEVFGVLPIRNLITQSPAWYQFIHGRNVQNVSSSSQYILNPNFYPTYFKQLAS